MRHPATSTTSGYSPFGRSHHGDSTPRSVDLADGLAARCLNVAQGRNGIRHWTELRRKRNGVGAQRDQHTFDKEGGDSQHAFPVPHVLVVERRVDDAGEEIATHGGGT